MSAPDPRAVDELAEAVRRLAAPTSIPHRYAWLYAAGYEPRKGGHPGSGGRELNDVSRLIGATVKARAKLERAAKHVARAVAELNGADNALEELANLIDASADRTVVPVDVRRLRDVQRDAAARNRADGLSAQRRRVARGELLPGDGGLPKARVM